VRPQASERGAASGRVAHVMGIAFFTQIRRLRELLPAVL
jgi:hypothetical protein